MVDRCEHRAPKIGPLTVDKSWVGLNVIKTDPFVELIRFTIVGGNDGAEMSINNLRLWAGMQKCFGASR
uniref:Uncharacterized protein n=1 Tax=Romanomermis culicivorax TaxID=13658 RepID=A0A915J417_ROMCU